jgi:threonine/homoserine/homoserine lactone efflux protein
MSSSVYLAYVSTALVIMLIPGPDVLFCIATGMRGGRAAGLAAACGAATGEVVHIALSAVGLAAIFRAAPALYDAVRLLGAAYLIVLGIGTLRRRDERHEGAPKEERPTGRSYRRGLATNLLNPKMALFAIAFLPQFVDRHAGHVALQFLQLGATFVVLDLLIMCGAGLLAARFAAALRSRRAQRRLETTAGVIYLGLGARIAFND